MSFKKRYKGVTLFEVLLVLAIAASIIIMSIKQYQSYRFDADIQAVRYNVDTIFEAMAQYYKVNCYGSIDPAHANQDPYGQIIPGGLNPDNSQIGTNPTSIPSVPIDIQQTLAGKGFWPISIAQTTTPTPPNPPVPPTTQPPLIPPNPLVDTTGPGYQGYVAQFNPYVENRMICTVPSSTPVVNPLDSSQCSGASVMATVLLWKIQVAILLGDPNAATDQTLATSYLNLFGGDCLSTYDATTKTVMPCAQMLKSSAGSGPIPVTGANYVVWERLPSLASPHSQSGYSSSNATVKQFNQMYTTYPILLLIAPGNNGNIPNGTPQYLYCGG